LENGTKKLQVNLPFQLVMSQDKSRVQNLQCCQIETLEILLIFTVLPITANEYACMCSLFYASLS